MPGVLTIRTGAFAGNKSVEVQADVLEEIEDGAFEIPPVYSLNMQRCIQEKTLCLNQKMDSI